MNTKRKIFCLLFAICIVSSSAIAQKVGSTSMQFLRVMPVPRGTALGDAYSALSSGAEAVFWNPGGVALVQNQEFSTTYINWIFDTRQGAFSYAASLGTFGAFGVQLQYVDFGQIDEAIWAAPYNEQIDNPGLTGNTFRPYSYLAGLTYAKSLTDKFAFGVSVKYARESLYNDRMVIAHVSSTQDEEVKTWANGLLFDFGIRYATGFRSIQIAASVQNFGGNVTYAKESNPVPLLFRWGVAADLMGKDALLSINEDNRVTVAFDLFQPNDYDQQEHMGIEYEYAGVLALRAGYKANYDFEGPTFGAGIKQTFGSVKFSLDYSYGSVGTYLGSVHRIGLGAIIE